MFHANTRKVIDDWNARRGARRAPDRADISPGAFSELLPQLFILGRADHGAEAFRLAGGLLVDLHDRDLRGLDFFSLWMGADAERVRDALNVARRAGVPVVLEASGWSAAGDEARLEIVLAPLVGPTGEMDRVLGLYQPTSSTRRLLGARVETLTLNEIRLADTDVLSAFLPAAPLKPRASNHLRLVTLDGERIG